MSRSWRLFLGDILEAALKVDRVDLEAVQSGLREVVRRIAVADGLPVDGWAPERIDRLLRRLAAFAPGPCPPVLDVAEGCHRDHTAVQVDANARGRRPARGVEHVSRQASH